MKVDKYYKKIELPQYRTTIYFMDLSQLKGQENSGAGVACILGDSKEELNIGIFIQDIKKNSKEWYAVSTFAHEIMHAIQMMCEKMGMKIEEEKESTAYLMDYLLSEVLTGKQK